MKIERPEGRNHPLRIALLSTPRSGNTWFRRLVATMYQLQERAEHSPEALDWSTLPERVILQLHWRYQEPLISLLERHQFRVVVLSRHPLDLLISILHFAAHEAGTARWLEGEGGDERTILGALPRSSALLEYATGPRAAALMSVTHEWRQAEGSYGLRYEDLVHDPAAELRRLALALDQPASPEAISEAIAVNSMVKLREGSRNQHFWQGRPGLWKDLFPAATARRIAARHHPILEAGGYECDPDEALTDGQADCRWLQLEIEASQAALSRTKTQLGTLQNALGETQAKLAASQSLLSETRTQLATSQSHLSETRDQLAASQSHLNETRAQLETSQRFLVETQTQLADTSARLDDFESLGPTVIEVARRLRRTVSRHPRIASALKRIARRSA